MELKKSLALFCFVAPFFTILPFGKPAQADCTQWHPHHCSTGDLEREINSCLNGGGCSLPADEVWGEAGRLGYVAAQGAIAANNSTLPSEPLDAFQKRRLRLYYGDLVDQVRIKYGATTLDNWRVGGFTISTPSAGQAFCNDIYITRRYSPNDVQLLELVAHEMMHSLQCQRLGGASNFGYHYFKEYKRANQNYRNNSLEVEAYDFVASIDWYSEPLGGSELINNQSGMCLDVAENRPGGNVVIDLCEGLNLRPYQSWGWNGSSYYNAQSGLCLDVAQNRPGGNVVIDRCEGSSSRPYQVWSQESTVLYNHESGLCLDVAQNRPGGNVVIDRCEGSSSRPYQVWLNP